MRIPCPFCGDRDVHEFSVRGEVGPQRPEPAAADAADQFFNYLYPKNNPAGANREHWYHASGCRQWLTVERDTRTHAVLGVTLARGEA